MTHKIISEMTQR